MREQNQDMLVVYVDKEHGGNVAYLTGFIPRFKEALVVLGNENFNLAPHARLKNQVLHAP